MTNDLTGLLERNGWCRQPTEDGTDHITFCKADLLGFDLAIDESQVVVLADIGDIAILPFNYYALLGYLIDKRQLGWDYKP